MEQPSLTGTNEKGVEDFGIGSSTIACKGWQALRLFTRKGQSLRSLQETFEKFVLRNVGGRQKTGVQRAAVKILNREICDFIGGPFGEPSAGGSRCSSG